MKFKNEYNKLKGLVSDRVWEILQECNAIIAGGAITSVFCRRDVNDLDVYFRSEADFSLFIDLVFDGDFCLIANNLTNRSVLFKDKETNQHVQTIVYKFFPAVEDIFKDYDFVCNMGAFEFEDNSELADQEGRFILHDNFMKHNSQRYLEFNEGTAYPLISALRVQKYVDKGYFCPKAQFLRILLAVNNKQIDSWDKLKDEIGGMYGLNMDEIFKEDEEFSLESALNTLNEIESDTAFVDFNKSISKDEIIDKIALKDVDDSDRISAKDKFFKNVNKDGEYGYQSVHSPNFKYIVGETVNGGTNGIYCYEGYDVLDGYYSECGHILELEMIENETSLKSQQSIPSAYAFASDAQKIQLIGNVKVVAAYTRSQFIRKFKK